MSWTARNPISGRNSPNATSAQNPAFLNARAMSVSAEAIKFLRERARGALRESERVERPPHPDPLPASGEREKKHRGPRAPPAVRLRWSPKPRRCFRSRRCSRNAGPGSRDRAATGREPHRVRSRHAVRHRPQQSRDVHGTRSQRCMVRRVLVGRISLHTRIVNGPDTKVAVRRWWRCGAGVARCLSFRPLRHA